MKREYPWTYPKTKEGCLSCEEIKVLWKYAYSLGYSLEEYAQFIRDKGYRLAVEIPRDKLEDLKELLKKEAFVRLKENKENLTITDLETGEPIMVSVFPRPDPLEEFDRLVTQVMGKLQEIRTVLATDDPE